MNTLKVILVLGLSVTLISCQTQTATDRTAEASTIGRQQKSDVRQLRTKLIGKSMREVVQSLGQPADAYTLDDREIWNYQDTVRDSITGRPVHFLEITFKKRIVQSVNFSF